VLCAPNAGTVSATYSDPAVAMSWTGTNGTFADACDEGGNLTKYSCDVTLICSGGVNAECSDVDTGAVKPWAIDCSGHCADGTCPSRCPTFGETLTVQSVDPAGDVTLVDSADGRSFACTLSQDMASDAAPRSTPSSARRFGPGGFSAPEPPGQPPPPFVATGGGGPASGSSTVNSDPRPIELRACTVPPWARAISWTT
jgi:hypothetical protein